MSARDPIFLQHHTHRKGTSLSDKSASSNEYDHLPPLTHPTNAIFRHYERNAQPATYGFQLSSDRSPAVVRKKHYVPKTMNTTTTIKMPPGADPASLGASNAHTPRSRKKTFREFQAEKKNRKLWWSPKRNHIEIRSDELHFHQDATSRINSLDNVDYRPSGGNISIRDEPVHWQTGSKIDSLSNAHWSSQPSRVAIRSEKVQWDAEARVDSLANVDYRPKGGNIAIRDDRMDLAHVTPRVDCGFVEE